MELNNMFGYNIAEVAKLIKNANKIAITAHVNPDPDALGSVLALGKALPKIGKEITMVIDDDISDSLSFMPYIKEVVRPETLNTQQFDLLVVLDASDIERIGEVSNLTNAPILNIDHHISNTEFAKYLCLDVDAAATAEIIYLLIKELKIDIDLEIATNLYTGIATDCGFFQYANTTARTMMCAAELMQYGIKVNYISDCLAAKSKEALILLIKVLEGMEFYANDKIAVITMPKELADSKMDTDGFINHPRYIQGVEVAVFCKYKDDYTTRISMRSKELDVSAVALDFGGGGHKRAAGCTIHSELNKSKNLIVQTLIKAINNERL